MKCTNVFCIDASVMGALIKVCALNRDSLILSSFDLYEGKSPGRWGGRGISHSWNSLESHSEAEHVVLLPFPSHLLFVLLAAIKIYEQQ